MLTVTFFLHLLWRGGMQGQKIKDSQLQLLVLLTISFQSNFSIRFQSENILLWFLFVVKALKGRWRWVGRTVLSSTVCSLRTGGGRSPALRGYWRLEYSKHRTGALPTSNNNTAVPHSLHCLATSLPVFKIKVILFKSLKLLRRKVLKTWWSIVLFVMFSVYLSLH